MVFCWFESINCQRSFFDDIFWCAVVKAYQYTSITSIMLLDCWSIPSVIFLTWFFLKTKYRFRKAIGVAICVVGLVVVVFSDVHAKDRSGKRTLFYAIFFDFVLWFICFCYSTVMGGTFFFLQWVSWHLSIPHLFNYFHILIFDSNRSAHTMHVEGSATHSKVSFKLA